MPLLVARKPRGSSEIQGCAEKHDTTYVLQSEGVGEANGAKLVTAPQPHVQIAVLLHLLIRKCRFQSASSPMNHRKT